MWKLIRAVLAIYFKFSESDIFLKQWFWYFLRLICQNVVLLNQALYIRIKPGIICTDATPIQIDEIHEIFKQLCCILLSLWSNESKAHEFWFCKIQLCCTVYCVDFFFSFHVVRGVKMTLPLRREKAVADCGELYIELDDLQVSVGDPLGGTSPASRSPEPASTTSQSVTAPNGDATTSSRLVAEATNQIDLMSLDTPDMSRRGTGGSSPTTSPTPTTTGTTSVGNAARVGVAASLAATVGNSTATLGGSSSMGSGVGGGRSSGNNSPAPPSSSSTTSTSHSSPQPPQQNSTNNR